MAARDLRLSFCCLTAYSVQTFSKFYLSQGYRQGAAVPLEHPGAHYILELKTLSEVYKYQNQLCTILQECVNEGSSIGFLAPLSSKDALDYWLGVSELITKGNLHLFILTSATSSTVNSEHTPVLGTLQLSLVPGVAHLHRAEVIKLMVLPSA